MRIAALSLLVPAVFAADWGQYLGGNDSSQYSALKQINKSNVKQLQPVWTFPTEGAEQYLFSPTVIGGVMFVQARKNSLIALDAATGKELWTHLFTGPVTQRGINYWSSKDGKDRRLFTVNAGFLTAVDAATGKTVLSFGDNGRVDLRSGLERDLTYSNPIQTNNPGRVFEDIVIMPLMRSGGDYQYMPGDIHAYDARTGKLLWQFHTIPRPGEFGYSTWPKDFFQRNGGAINWNDLAIDDKRGIAYVPTGTGKFDHYGADRIGSNLFANSVIALNARTGVRMWHFQTVHHDLWDYDLPSGPRLLTVKHDGKNVDVLIQPTKHGFLFVLDRVTGQPLWPVEERRVPKSNIPGEEAWPTQPFPTKPPPFARQELAERDINPLLPPEEREVWLKKFRAARNEGLFTPPSFEGTVTSPGVGGGASWGTTTIDPVRGFAYVVSRDAPTIVTIVDPEKATAQEKARAKGPGGPQMVPVDGPFVHYLAPYTNFNSEAARIPTISPPWFTMTAYNLNTGTIQWQIPYGTVPSLTERNGGPTGVIGQRGGPVLTAGGLIFSATNDRKFRAYDQDSGKVLWEYELPAPAEGVPAVFELGGKEYVVVCAAGQPQPLDRGAPATGAYLVFALR